MAALSTPTYLAAMTELERLAPMEIKAAHDDKSERLRAAANVGLTLPIRLGLPRHRYM